MKGVFEQMGITPMTELAVLREKLASMVMGDDV
jgi:hypothetical protein